MSTPTLRSGQLGGLKTRKAAVGIVKPSIMIYGGSGIGKTTLAASACEVPEMSPVLHINIENGIGESIQDKYPDLDVYDVDTFKDLQTVFDYLNRTKDVERGTVGEEGWRACILDNLTESQKQGMAHLFPDAGSPKFDDVLTGSWGDGTWNKNSEQMRVLIRAFRTLPVHTIFVAWERDLSKTDSKLVDLVPSFSPSFAKEAPGMLNDVFWYHFTSDGARVLETGRGRTWTAKDRSGKLPQQIIDPTMSKLNDYWTGKLVRPAAATTATSNGLKPLTRKVN